MVYWFTHNCNLLYSFQFDNKFKIYNYLASKKIVVKVKFSAKTTNISGINYIDKNAPPTNVIVFT